MLATAMPSCYWKLEHNTQTDRWCLAQPTYELVVQNHEINLQQQQYNNNVQFAKKNIYLQ